MPFQPGQSGNPLGRPKGSYNKTRRGGLRPAIYIHTLDCQTDCQVTFKSDGLDEGQDILVVSFCGSMFLNQKQRTDPLLL